VDFFERQDKARHKTKLLVFYFAVAVLLIDVCGYVVCATLFLRGRAAHGDLIALWSPQLFLGVSAATAAIVSFGSLYKIAELRSGGGAVARMLGGRLISPVTTDPDEKKLRNVIEEMSLASGVPVPEIYVLDEEDGINAFAAGHATSDAAVCVTRGCMRLLNRDELQGVIAHEFSHILNGDMRLNLRLIGLINGILCLAIVGRVLLNTSSSRSSNDRKGGNPLPFLGLALIILGGVGVFFGKLIKSAVSRQREFLADASAVQFTRNPLGLAGALKKIGGLSAGSRIQNAQAESASHLFFANGLSDSFVEVFATHPPLEERIRLLDPTFDGRFPEVDLPHRDRSDASEAAEPIAAAVAAAAPFTGRRASPPPLRAPPVMPQSFLQGAGQVTPKHLEYAAEVRSSLPEPLVVASRDPLGAVALVYSLLMSPDWATRVAQTESLQGSCEPGLFAEIQRIAPHLQSLPLEGRLPLLWLALPTLKMLSPAQYENFKKNMDFIINTDGIVDLREFAWRKLLLKNLEPRFAGRGPQAIQFYAWQPLLRDAAVLLSALAYVGQAEPDAAANAFAIGWAQLRAAESFAILPPEQASVTQVDAALNRLTAASPFIKKSMLNACAFTAAADERICPPEAELLRAVADVLDCPIPPFIEGI